MRTIESTSTPLTDMADGWIDVRAAARRARIGAGLIYQACARRELRHVRVGHGRHGLLRFRLSWVDQWLEARATGVEIPPRSGAA